LELISVLPVEVAVSSFTRWMEEIPGKMLTAVYNIPFGISRLGFSPGSWPLVKQEQSLFLMMVA
jgi:hypothetical protein